MSDLNLCQFIGRAGANPEVRYTSAGTAVCTLSIAVSQKWTDKDGKPQEQTEWVRVNFWAKLAEVVGEYVKKGKQVYVAGKLTTRKYTDKDGVEKYATEIRGEQIQLLGSKDEQQQAKPAKDTRTHAERKRPNIEDMEDDVPF